MFTVTIVEKGGTERRLTFDKEEVSIGRISGNDIILPKGNISKRHARVVVKDARFIVIDLKSTNGTYVNKERISAPRVIGADDKIYIGDFIMRLASGIRGGDQPAAEPTPAAPPAAPPPTPAQQFTPPAPTPMQNAATEHAPPQSKPDASDSVDIGFEDEDEATRAVAMSDVEALMGDAGAIEFGVQEPEVEIIADPVSEAPLPEAEEVEAPSPWDEPSSELAVVDPEPEDDDEEDGYEPTLAVDLDGLEDAIGNAAPGLAAPEADDDEAVEFGIVEPEPESVEPEPELDVFDALAAEPAVSAPAEPETAEDEAELEQVVETPPPATATPPAQEPEAAEAEPPLVDEDAFDQYVQVLEMLHDQVAAEVFSDVDPDEMDLSDSQWARLESSVSEVVGRARAEGLVPDALETSTLTQDLLYEFTGLGPVEYFLADDNVGEMLVNDYHQIFVSHGDTTNAFYKSFSSPAALERTADKLALSLGFTAETRPPIMNGELPDGTHFQVLLPPLAPRGPVLIFQKPPAEVATMQTFLEQGGLSDEMAEYLFERVAERANIAVTGRRGADRTALLNALGYFVPETDRIVVVEGRAEVALPHGNVIRLRLPALPEEAEQLFAIMPSLLADRLVVSGATSDAAVSLLTLALGGAEGVLFTTYGHSPADAVARLTTRAQLLGKAPSRSAAEALAANALDVIVHLDGARITAISEVSATADGIRLQEIFRADGSGGFRRVGGAAE